MLPLLGINRNIRKGWRSLPKTFGSIGLLNLSVEQHICRINLFCQYYGSSSMIGLKLSASLHWLKLQLGCPGNPLLLNYEIWGHLATKSWIKLFWEALAAYPGSLAIHFEPIPAQRIHDQPLMKMAVDAGLRNQDLLSFNRCQCTSNLLFLLDVSTALGDTTESWVRNRHAPHISKYDFPPECPTDHDWSIWNQFWRKIRYLSPSLGPWTSASHFQWPWHLDESSGILYCVDQNEYKFFEQQSNRTRLSLGYIHTSSIDSLPPCLPVLVTSLLCAGCSTILNPQIGPTLFNGQTSMDSVWDLLL